MYKNKKSKNIVVNIIISALVVILMLPTCLFNCKAKGNEVSILDLPVTEGVSHNVIYENEMHYINLPKEDLAFPSFAVGGDYKFIVYCMNNSLLWPHATADKPNVPSFIDGYLSADNYEKVLKQLTLLLYAGYPNNGRNLYEITDAKTITAISDEDMDIFLVPSDDIKQAFPELEMQTFTYHKYISKDEAQKQFVSKFMTDVLKVQVASENTINGVKLQDITNSSFYKAISCLYYASDSGKSPLELFVEYGYAADYIVTKEQAYSATQNVVWYLLKENDVENNQKSSSLDSELARKLYHFATTADLNDFIVGEPDTKKITKSSNFIYGYSKETGEELSTELVFSYDSELGKYTTNRNVLNVPNNFPQVFEVDLPEGVSVLETGNNQVVAGQYYTLVSDTMPDDNAKITFKADAKWIKALRQYSPKDSKDYQNMVGEVVDQKALEFGITTKNSMVGDLIITNEVRGNAANPDDEFTFTVRATLPDGEPLMGEYGEASFDLSEDGSSGEAAFTLKGGESIRLSGLFDGTSYTVTENDNNKSYLVSVNGNAKMETSGTIEVKKEAKEDFLNIKNLYDVEIDAGLDDPETVEISNTEEEPNADDISDNEGLTQENNTSIHLKTAEAPAADVVKTSETSSKPVKTGDDSLATIYIVALIISAGIVVSLICSKKRIYKK